MRDGENRISVTLQVVGRWWIKKRYNFSSLILYIDISDIYSKNRKRLSMFSQQKMDRKIKVCFSILGMYKGRCIYKYVL